MNTTEDSVLDKRRKLTAEELGRLQKKTNEIMRRIEDRAILYEDALAGMQDIIEGKSKRLRLDLIPGKPKKWWEENGVIYLKVISDGTTGEQWIERLTKKGFKLSKYAKELLLSKEFQVTTGIEYTIAILKGGLFTDYNRITNKIRSEAAERKLATPNPEIACLIRELLSYEEIKAIGLGWIVIFHEPIDSESCLNLLSVFCRDGGSLLSASGGSPSGGWSDNDCFVFELSRKKVA